jgi:chemotaxis protein CheD
MFRMAKIAEICISKNPEDILGVFGLGSCLGIILYDPKLKVGGILHSLLPSMPNCRQEGLSKSEQPLLFVDQGLPLLYQQLKVLGAVPDRLKAYIAGGATFGNDQKDLFAIGLRNFVVACETLRGLKLPLTAKDVGGRISRTVNLEVGSGRVWLESGGKARDL